MSERNCWTCGAGIDLEMWELAPREPSNEDLRVCARCHHALEWLPNARQVANMIRHVAGIPPVGEVDCGPPDGWSDAGLLTERRPT